MDDRYGVYVDDVAVPCNVRHSLNGYDQFSMERDLGRLSDDYLEGQWVKPDTPVHKYTFQVENTGGQQGGAVTAAFWMKTGTEDRWLYSSDQSGYHAEDDGMVEVSGWVWDGTT